MNAGTWVRRAQPLLGTLVEIGLPADAEAAAAFDAGFAALRSAQACLSRFDPNSDVSRFHALPSGHALALHPVTRQVLAAARELQQASGGVFDISLGTAPEGWRLDGDHLLKRHAAVRLDLGGIGKGHAVDLAVAALQERGVAAGWVNAGGDLRAFGAVDVPVQLRDEGRGGAHAFAQLRDGAFATSAFGAPHRARLVLPDAAAVTAQVSVASPLCLWADALTKLVGAAGDQHHPLLARYGAQAWLH